MKVLFVMEDSFPVESAGCPIRNRYVMEHLKSIGLEIIGLTSPFMKIFTGSVIEGSEVINNIRYYRSQYMNTINGVNSAALRWVKRIPMFRRYCNLLEKICLQEKPDIIHTIGSYFLANASNKIGRKNNIPKLYEVRSFVASTGAINDGRSINSFKYQTVWKLDKKAMLGADRVAPLSEVLKSELVKRGIPESKIDVVNNVVDTDKIKPQERSQELVNKYSLNNNTVIGYLGSIRRLEGLLYLIKAAPQIIARCSNIRFMIVGGGKDLENIKNLARQYGIMDLFIFTGLVPHNEVTKYYSVIDIFTIPRVNALVNQTVTPLKPLEVMATEKVVVGSDVGGLATLIKDGETGVLFRAEDTEDLTKKVMELVNDKQKRLDIGKKARQWVINNREVKNITEQYIPIYEKMLG